VPYRQETERGGYPPRSVWLVLDCGQGLAFRFPAHILEAERKGNRMTQRAQGPCPACGQEGADVRVPEGWLPCRAPVLRCRRCGTAFFAQRAPEPDYWEARGQVEVYADPEVRAGFVAAHTRALAELEAIRGGRGRLLDVGCGDGLFLRLARERGWNAVGLESSPHGARAAAEASGCGVRTGRVAALQAGEAPFDAITLWDVIEHQDDALAMMGPLVDVLAPGGVVGLRTPDEGSWFRRVVHAAQGVSGGAARGLLKYMYYHPHYVVFTRTGLASLCARSGLVAVRMRREFTPLRFAQAKIRHAYARFPGHRLLVAALPLLYAAAGRGGGNKLVAYARRRAGSGG